MALWNEINTWDTSSLKLNEKKVYEAIRIILKDPESIEIFNKKAIYLYIDRKSTRLNSSHT